MAGPTVTLAGVGTVANRTDGGPGSAASAAPMPTLGASPAGTSTPGPSRSPVTRRYAVQSPRPISPPSAAALAGLLDDCLVADDPEGFDTEISGVACSWEPECYGEITETPEHAYAFLQSCTTEHSWQTFLVGPLPESTGSANQDAVARDPWVERLCTRDVLRIALGGQADDGWSVEVLPPNQWQFAEGARFFRCLAGKGPGSLKAQHVGSRR